MENTNVKALEFYLNELAGIELDKLEIVPDIDSPGRYELRHKPDDDVELPGGLHDYIVDKSNYGGFELEEISLHDGKIKPYNAETMIYNAETGKVTIERLVSELDKPVTELAEILRRKGYEVEILDLNAHL